MDLGDVMDALAARLETVDGLRAFAYPVAAVNPPTAVVGYPPEIVFDATYGRGMDTMQVPIVIIVGRPTDRSTRDRLARFCSGSGPASVKAAIDAAGYTDCDDARVARIDIEPATIAGIEYLTALVTVDVSGPGTP